MGFLLDTVGKIDSRTATSRRASWDAYQSAMEAEIPIVRDAEVYIDPVNGDDSTGSGTALAPYKTLGKLATLNAAQTVATTYYIVGAGAGTVQDVWAGNLTAHIFLPKSCSIIGINGRTMFHYGTSSNLFTPTWTSQGNGRWTTPLTATSFIGISEMGENRWLREYHSPSWMSSTANVEGGIGRVWHSSGTLHVNFGNLDPTTLTTQFRYHQVNAQSCLNLNGNSQKYRFENLGGVGWGTIHTQVSNDGDHGFIVGNSNNGGTTSNTRTLIKDVWVDESGGHEFSLTDSNHTNTATWMTTESRVGSCYSKAGPCNCYISKQKEWLVGKNRFCYGDHTAGSDKKSRAYMHDNSGSTPADLFFDFNNFAGPLAEYELGGYAAIDGNPYASPSATDASLFGDSSDPAAAIYVSSDGYVDQLLHEPDFADSHSISAPNRMIVTGGLSRTTVRGSGADAISADNNFRSQNTCILFDERHTSTRSRHFFGRLSTVSNQAWERCKVVITGSLGFGQWQFGDGTNTPTLPSKMIDCDIFILGTKSGMMNNIGASKLQAENCRFFGFDSTIDTYLTTFPNNTKLTTAPSGVDLCWLTYDGEGVYSGTTYRQTLALTQNQADNLFEIWNPTEASIALTLSGAGLSFADSTPTLAAGERKAIQITPTESGERTMSISDGTNSVDVPVSSAPSPSPSTNNRLTAGNFGYDQTWGFR